MVNVGKYTIHGSFGVRVCHHPKRATLFLTFFSWSSKKNLHFSKKALQPLMNSPSVTSKANGGEDCAPSSAVGGWLNQPIPKSSKCVKFTKRQKFLHTWKIQVFKPWLHIVALQQLIGHSSTCSSSQKSRPGNKETYATKREKGQETDLGIQICQD